MTANGQGAPGRPRSNLKDSYPGEWHERANCKGETHLFFPTANEKGKYDREEVTSQTKVRCGLCPVSTECLEWAIATNAEGVCADTTTRQRVELRRQRRQLS